MNSDKISFISSLGFLRIALLLLALVNMLIPLVDTQVVQDTATERSLWNVIATFIAPVLAPLLTVVILFDYIMSRVRAADAEGQERVRYVGIGRIELAVIGVTLLFWVPFFVLLMT